MRSTVAGVKTPCSPSSEMASKPARADSSTSSVEGKGSAKLRALRPRLFLARIVLSITRGSSSRPVVYRARPCYRVSRGAEPGSALDAGDDDALNVIALREEEDQHHRDDRQDRLGHRLLYVGHVARIQQRQAE